MKTNKNWWDDKTTNAQLEYLSQHPKSKLNVRRLMDSENVDKVIKNFSDFQEAKKTFNEPDVSSVTLESSLFTFIEFLENKFGYTKNQLTHNKILNTIGELFEATPERISISDFNVKIKLSKKDTRIDDLNYFYQDFCKEVNHNSIENLKKQFVRVMKIEKLNKQASFGLFLVSEIEANTPAFQKNKDRVFSSLDKTIDQIKVLGVK